MIWDAGASRESACVSEGYEIVAVGAAEAHP